MASAILWPVIDAALRRPHHEVWDSFSPAGASLRGALLMTEPGTDDHAWFIYLRDTADALLDHRMGWVDE